MTRARDEGAAAGKSGPSRRGGRGRSPRKETETTSKTSDAPRAEQERRAPRAAGQNGPGWGPIRVQREIGGRMLTLETGRMAKLSDGACVVSYGDTVVLATAQSSKEREDIDFFPLTVEYREKPAAAGKFPGGFFKREGRPTTKEILGSRVIDRAIRPLFPDGFKREVQVLSQVLSTDQETESDIPAAIASFAALALSSIPHRKLLGACRIGLVGEKLLVNPTWSVVQSEQNLLSLTVAAHRDAVVMVEAGARQVKEDVLVEAIELGHRVCREIVELIEELVAKAGKPKQEFAAPSRDEQLVRAIEKQFGKRLLSIAVHEGNKQERKEARSALMEEVAAAFPAPEDATDKETRAHEKLVSAIAVELVDRGERESILAGRRADGRDLRTIRQITIEVGVLPKVHGSALFTRGETQALVVATLGTADDEQMLDGIYPESPRRFLLHYNFPPFSVGEVKRIGSVGRREIGHGALAERSVEGVLPKKDAFPYTIRITSEILESNGSSSMATVCGATLALMDAGVQLSQPVAGVAMGLVMEGKRYAILSDILGSEDHCGDMDFKVAGTGKGVTALQMDIKCEGLTRAILEEALEQAREGRLHVLREMLNVMRRPRAEISPNAPRLISLKIPIDKIGLVIGPSGKMIRGLQEEFTVRINIEDDGTVTVAGTNSEKVDACVQRIRDMTAEVEVGKVYKGRVSSIKEFGAFVEILPGQEGLVHVSELSNTFLRAVTDAVRLGDEIEVKVIAIDDFGKIKLSRRALLGEPPEGEGGPPRGERPERGERGERGERWERRDRGERGDRGDRGDRGGRGERGDRGERGWSGDRGERDRDRDRGERDRGERDRDRDRERFPDRVRDSERGQGEREPRRERGGWERPAEPGSEPPVPPAEHVELVHGVGDGEHYAPTQHWPPEEEEAGDRGETEGPASRGPREGGHDDEAGQRRRRRRRPRRD